MITKSYKPLVPNFQYDDLPDIAQSATYSYSPTLSCDNLTALHFGHSFLFQRGGVD